MSHTVLNWALSIALAASLTRNAAAIQTTADTDPLRKVIKISASGVTLESVLQQMADQTGLKISAAEYLRNHRISLILNGISARTALDTIAGMNDWEWHEVRPGELLMSRPTIRRPRDFAEMGAAHRRALPRDVRTYLDLEITDEELARRPLAEPLSRIEEAMKHRDYRLFTVMRRTERKVDRLLKAAEASLDIALRARIKDQQAIRVTEMFPVERELLTVLLFMPGVQQMARHSDEIDLLLGRLPGYLVDVNRAEIDLQGGIGVSSKDGDGRRGFGAQLSVPRAPH